MKLTQRSLKQNRQQLREAVAEAWKEREASEIDRWGKSNGTWRLTELLFPQFGYAVFSSKHGRALWTAVDILRAGGFPVGWMDYGAGAFHFTPYQPEKHIGRSVYDIVVASTKVEQVKE